MVNIAICVQRVHRFSTQAHRSVSITIHLCVTLTTARSGNVIGLWFELAEKLSHIFTEAETCHTAKSVCGAIVARLVRDVDEYVPAAAFETDPRKSELVRANKQRKTIDEDLKRSIVCPSSEHGRAKDSRHALRAMGLGSGGVSAEWEAQEHELRVALAWEHTTAAGVWATGGTSVGSVRYKRKV